MDLWTSLPDILILLLAAMVLGGLCERLRQSAILGYLLAGTLLGPNALEFLPNHQTVSAIAELGVALLLFTIGLEFSRRKLRGLKLIAVGGGSLQIVLTTVVTAVICVMFGLNWSSSLAIGAIVALSSTACVLRLLSSRSEVDSVHGRNAIGILLMQDTAVVPLVLVTSAIATGDTPLIIVREIARAIGGTALFIGVSYLLLSRLAPKLLTIREAARNRELPILLAIVTALGSAWAAHRVGISPAIGSFTAGLLLAGSPFAAQIRADIASVRTLFVTLFFSSIGMVADPVWAMEHWPQCLAIVAAVIIGKTTITCAVLLLFQSLVGHALATGICLAQIGEFSFVLAEIAREGGLISDDLFKLVISATIATLFLTPYMASAAPALARIAARSNHDSDAKPRDTQTRSAKEAAASILIVGFGPAGQRVGEALIKHHLDDVLVLELNPKSAAVAASYGLQVRIGDATRAEVLESVHISAVRIVAITLPDPASSSQVIEQVRALAPNAAVIARARYHIHRWQLTLAGAHTVIDEEEEVGKRMATAVHDSLETCTASV